MKLLPVSMAALMVLGGVATGAHAQNNARSVVRDVAQTRVAKELRATYIVQLAAEPAASYDGSVAGYAATRPAAGARFNARSSANQAYRSYLSKQQSAAEALVPGAQIVARYNTVYNGFAAKLSDAEVATLRASPLVVEVQLDQARTLETISTSGFLKLSTPGGVWSQTVGGVPVKGENVVIGIVDGGVWPENPAYADRVDGTGKPVFTGGTSAYGPPPAGWLGSCQPGEGFPATTCNNKLIGAQFFNAGFIASSNVLHWTDFVSPRDSVAGALGKGGHGTHTSTTAGGNQNNPAVLSGINIGIASGMAPRARVSTYKVCWTYLDAGATDGTGNRNACFNSDSVSAIDKAVADGVNVINYSISGSQTSVNDPVEQAFLRAAVAGVFVAASAGNSGPGNAVAHVSPWLTTVAASTHDRSLSANVTLGNGNTYTGASINNTLLPATAMIRAEDAGVAGAPANLNLCILSPLALDPAKVAGKVVVCTRGVNARVDKSAAVQAAGGVGMVLVDNGAGLVADVHSVPSVHVNAADGAIIKAYAATAGSTAAIGTYFNSGKPAPIMAGFSSRGPNQGDANMLKPDLTAPGVDVIAGVTADLTEAQRNMLANGTLVAPYEFASYQGTSMSSPHVAGVAALLKQAHPTWSPAMIKSALMTSAYVTLDDGLVGLQNGRLPWSQGAGHIDPPKAIDPGLVYDLTATDYIRYQCKVNRPAVIPASDCVTFGTLDETYNLNLPSITLGAIPGVTTVTRKVMNVGAASATYNSTATVPGFNAVVTPASLTLAPGASQTFTLQLTPTTAVAGAWNYGSLTWTDGVHVVKSPVTARTGATVVAPALLSGTTTSGSKLITITTGVSGRLTADKGGLKPVTLGPVTSLVGAATDQAQLKAICTTGVDTAAVKVYNFTFPAGTIVGRFALRNVDVTSGSDHDLLLLSPAGVDTYSGNGGSAEEVQVTSPAAGNWKVCVVNYDNGLTATHKLSSWVVSTADSTANFNVLMPGQAYSGSTATVGAAWRGLDTNERYTGGFRIKDPAGAVQTTTVMQVNTGIPAPTAVSRAISTRALGN